MLSPPERPATPASAEAERAATRLDAAVTPRDSRLGDALRPWSGLPTPVVTHSLVAVIAVVFALQALWGGIDLPPLLRSMGALVPERVRAGEWWRYFACTFLHGGALHVGLNGVVLWMLGRSLERFIGSARFMLIYFAAGLAGSITSSVFVTSQSVGASGAIWGLLGAEAALAFYPRPLLPPALIGVARRTAGANLALNLVNSFNPHVDLAAHVGGGLTGALVLVLLAATGRLSSHGRAPLPSGRGLRVLAALLAGLFLAGLVTAMLQGRPWRLKAAPELERVALSGSPWTIDVPRDRSAPAHADEGPNVFGNLAFDPTVVDVGWAAAPLGAEEESVEDVMAVLQRKLRDVPAGLELAMPPRVVPAAASARRPIGSVVTVRYRYTSNAELAYEQAFGLIDGVIVRVDVVGWAELTPAVEGLAPRILRSLEQRRASPEP